MKSTAYPLPQRSAYASTLHVDSFLTPSALRRFLIVELTLDLDFSLF
jgi:hypothetical protein